MSYLFMCHLDTFKDARGTFVLSMLVKPNAIPILTLFWCPSINALARRTIACIHLGFLNFQLLTKPTSGTET